MSSIVHFLGIIALRSFSSVSSACLSVLCNTAQPRNISVLLPVYSPVADFSLIPSTSTQRRRGQARVLAAHHESTPNDPAAPEGNSEYAWQQCELLRYNKFSCVVFFKVTKKASDMIGKCSADVCGLPCEKPYMGYCDIRHADVPRVFWYTCTN